MKKIEKLMLSEDANEAYEILNKIVGEEIEKGIKNSIHQQLLKSINRAFELLKENPVAGIQIPKRNIPKLYIEKFGVNNLWKFNLAGYWRMLYSLRTDEIEIVGLILDIIDHGKYNKNFGYRKK